jgi:hypothetical protein
MRKNQQKGRAASSRKDEAMDRLEREDAGICTMYLSNAGTKSQAHFRKRYVRPCSGNPELMSKQNSL